MVPWTTKKGRPAGRPFSSNRLDQSAPYFFLLHFLIFELSLTVTLGASE